MKKKRSVIALCLVFCTALTFLFSCTVKIKDSPSSSAESEQKDESQPEISESFQDESEEPEPEGYSVPRIYIYARNINKEGYVDAKIRIVDKNGGNFEFESENALIKVRGNSTSSGPKKPYNIKFEEKESLLGLGRGKKWCLLANLYDKTLIRNKLVYDFSKDMGMPYVPDCEFVDLYLNSAYIGNYLLSEPAEAGETRIDIDKKANEFVFEYEPYENYSNPEFFYTPRYGILLGFRDEKHPTESQKAYALDFFKDAEYALHMRNFDKLSEYFDMESFADSFIINEFFKNVDYQTSSTRFYLKGGKLYAGPVWDFDLSAGNADAKFYKPYHNNMGTVDDFASCRGDYCTGIWNSRLLQMEKFRELIALRYEKFTPLIENLFSDNELGKNRIDALIEKYGESFEKNYRTGGWSMTKKYVEYERIPFPTYEENVEYLREWLKRRHEWFLKAYCEK